MRKYLGALLYLGLLACALVYVRNSFIEYWSGNTLYTMSQKPVTVHDVPTITLCSDLFGEMPFEGEYGKTLRIELSDLSERGTIVGSNFDGGFSLNVSKISFGISANKGEYTCRKL